MQRRAVFASVIAAALAACGSSPRLAVDPAAPGTIALTVTLPPTDTEPTTELWLRDASGATRFEFLGNDGTFRFEGLASGAYDLAAKIGFELDGPWLYVHERVVVRPGEATVVALALPSERRAGFAVRVTGESPPYFLALAEEGATFPSDMRALQSRLAQHTYPDGLVFALQSDGRRQPDDLPSVPAGRYVLVQVANDWQLGDPPPQGRTLDVELRAGATTTIVLEEKLTRMRVE